LETDKVDDLGGKNNAKHDEIKRGMSGLFAKLDALYNYHYTPKSVCDLCYNIMIGNVVELQLVAEVRIMKNMPSLELEEVGPTAASDSVIVAPEEAKVELL
jgi:U3 small nucleolar RNA-associated protein MPP10